VDSLKNDVTAMNTTPPFNGTAADVIVDALLDVSGLKVLYYVFPLIVCKVC
jgi:hypothetical protein